MTVLRGEAALDFMFGDNWRKLNAETERRDEERAQAYKVPCSRPGCGKYACATVKIDRQDELVCHDHIALSDVEDDS